MPKKIKKDDTKIKSKSEKLITPNNIHYFFIVITILVIGICVGVGIYVHKQDKYHVHKDNAIVLFEYTEKLDEGYNVFSLTQTNTKQIFTEYNSLQVQDVNELSRKKYLDFNEEVYNSGLLEFMSDKESILTDDSWSLYLKFADGTRKYLYSSPLGFGEEKPNIDKTKLANIIKKYFNEEILYK